MGNVAVGASQSFSAVDLLESARKGIAIEKAITANANELRKELSGVVTEGINAAKSIQGLRDDVAKLSAEGNPDKKNLQVLTGVEERAAALLSTMRGVEDKLYAMAERKIPEAWEMFQQAGGVKDAITSELVKLRELINEATPSISKSPPAMLP